MNETLFLVPRGNPGLTPLQLNMQTIIDAEHRVGEVAIMTPEKAPEMLATFNRAYLDLTRMLSYLELEANSAARHVNLRRSLLLLDIAPKTLADKHLATSKDLRDAVVDADHEYQELLERQGTIKAFQTLLEGKKKGIEMAYTSVKKILGDRPLGGRWTTPVHTPALREAELQPGQNADQAVKPEGAPAGGRFGKARY